MSRNKFLNSCEQEAYDILSPFEIAYGFKLFPKVKLGDVLEIRSSDLDDEHFQYGSRAHFDFVVVQDNRVRFAIEVDGPNHFNNDETTHRDRKKNYICEYLGFELLRVDFGYLNEVDGYRILPYLLQDYLEHHNPENKLTARDHKRFWTAPFDVSKISAERLKYLKEITATVHEKLCKYDAEISTLHAEEENFQYAAKYIEVGQKQFCIGQGSARPSKVWGENAKQLADCLSLIELDRRVKLFEQKKQRANSVSDIERIRTAYKAQGSSPNLRRLVVKSYSNGIDEGQHRWR